MKKPDEFKKILDEIENSKGYKIDSESYKLENSFKIMIINYSHLRNIISSTPTFSTDQIDQKNKFIIEAARCFVNFLGSAGAFRDHTRKYIRKLYGSTEDAFNGEYQKKIESDFINDPLPKLLEALRNYYCHTEIPSVGIQTTLTNGTLNSDFVIFFDHIDTTEDSKFKEFINKHNKNTYSVLELADKYIYKTMFPWIMKESEKYNKEEFDKLKELKAKARKILEN